MHLRSGSATPSDCVVRLIRRWYDREAAYITERTAEYARFPGLLAEIEQFARSVGDMVGPVLDLGCGAGRDTEFLLGRGHRVVAGDVSAMMLHTTVIRCAPARPGCVQLDMRRLPFAAEAFAGAWVCASLVHVPRAQLGDCLTELYRTLRPGAKVAISMKSGDGDGWVPSGGSRGHRWFVLVRAEVFLAMMRACGFVDLSAVVSGRGTWYIAGGGRP
jgi:SAM-dependent methyltransferase